MQAKLKTHMGKFIKSNFNVAENPSSPYSDSRGGVHNVNAFPLVSHGNMSMSA
jgi:hypothetical protein